MRRPTWKILNDDKGQKVRAIVDNALSELIEVGVESADDAAFMMACQAAIRISDNEKMKELEKFVHDSIWDIDDTGGGK